MDNLFYLIDFCLFFKKLNRFIKLAISVSFSSQFFHNLQPFLGHVCLYFCLLYLCLGNLTNSIKRFFFFIKKSFIFHLVLKKFNLKLEFHLHFLDLPFPLLSFVHQKQHLVSHFSILVSQAEISVLQSGISDVVF